MTVQFRTRTALGALALSFLLASAAGAADYDESVLGDLSDDPGSPTLWSLEAGANVLTGSAGVADFDLLHLVIPAGHALESLVLDSYSNPFGGASFVAVAAGSTWTAGVDFDVNPAGLMGWVHFAATGSGGVGRDLLIPMSTAPSTSGFERPLPAGDYALLIQDTDNQVGYSMTFLVSGPQVPGDYDGNGRTDGADFLFVQRDLGTPFTADDLQTVLINLGAGATATTVPEPTAAALAAWLATAALGTRRCRKRSRG